MKFKEVSGLMRLLQVGVAAVREYSPGFTLPLAVSPSAVTFRKI